MACLSSTPNLQRLCLARPCAPGTSGRPAKLLYRETKRRRSTPVRERPAVASTSKGAAAAPAQQGTLRVELGTAGAQASLGLAATAVGRGKAIMISRVAPGSEAEQAGVRPGQRLLAVSDPVRRDEVWPLGDRSSLRYVRDALRMRRCDTVTLELAVDPMLDPGAAPGGPAGEAAAAAACAAASQDEAAASGGSLDEADLLQALERAAGRDLSPSDGALAEEPLTIGQRLERQYWAGGGTGVEPAKPALAAFEQRTRRRREYLVQTTQRNDAPFFAGLAALVLLPAGAILWAAAASGYLNKLAVGRF